MIKFTAPAGGTRKMVGFCLSRENIELLEAGQPIFIRGEQIGQPVFDFVICAGETEETIVAELKKFVDVEVK